MATKSPEDDEVSVRSIALDSEHGGQVVIEQQNVGPGNQVGAGEFKKSEETAVDKSPDEAAAEQELLEQQAPIKDDPRVS